MRKTKYSKKSMATGTIFLISIMSGNSLFLTIGLTLFIITICIDSYKMFTGKNTISNMSKMTREKAAESFRNKKYANGIINILSIPMMIVGIMAAVALLVIMWIRALS